MYLWFHNLLPWASSEQNQRTGCPTLFIARTPNRRTSGLPTQFIARIPMDLGRRQQVVQHCSYREPRTEELLVQQVGTRSNVQGATANSIRLSRWRIPAVKCNFRINKLRKHNFQMFFRHVATTSACTPPLNL